MKIKDKFTNHWLVLLRVFTLALERIPWEGEFIIRSDPWAGLIASCGSFYPMIRAPNKIAIIKKLMFGHNLQEIPEGVGKSIMRVRVGMVWEFYNLQTSKPSCPHSLWPVEQEWKKIAKKIKIIKSILLFSSIHSRISGAFLLLILNVWLSFPWFVLTPAHYLFILGIFYHLLDQE